MKKYNLFIFTMIFGFIFCMSSVKAVDKYTIEDQQYFDAYSNCCYKDENKGTLGIYRNSGGVTLYVRSVPKHTYVQVNPFAKTCVKQRLICTSNKDGSTVEIEARVYEDATVFDTSKLNGGKPTGSVCTSSTSCSSKKEIRFSRCSNGNCSSSEFIEEYTGCERIGAVSTNEIYAKAVYKKFNGKEGVAFYVTNSDKYVNKINEFSCVKAGTSDERECVTVTVEALAAISGDDTESGVNNLERDTKTITNGASKIDMIGYDSCHFDSTADPRNSYINIANNNSLRVASVPSENTNIYFKCKTSGTTSYRDVTVTVTPTATVFIDNDNPENNENNKSDQDSSQDNVNNDCTSIFGNIKDDGKTYDPDGNRLPSVAYVLQTIFNFMQFLGPILVIAFTVMDAVKAVASGDKDALNKLLKTTAKRMVYAVILFVFPTALKEILSWVTTSDPTCGIM